MSPGAAGFIQAIDRGGLDLRGATGREGGATGGKRGPLGGITVIYLLMIHRV
jgi:hypothetical protein